MKNFYSVCFFLFVTFLVSCGNKVSYEELDFKSDIAQYKGKPYTGSFFQSFPNGDIKWEGQFKDGLKVGKFTRYFDNKQILQEDSYIIKVYVDKPFSLQDGVQKQFHENGKPSYIFNYKEGDKEGLQESFNSNGFKYKIENYKDGKLEGEKIEYQYEGLEGVLKFKCNYQKGKPDGEMLQYWNDGTLWRKVFFKNGEKEGVEEVYNPKGVLIEKNVYTSGFKWESKSESFGNGEYIEPPGYLPAKKVKN
jgi:antitoxin component YwqK of YwqJK toxin-antitoxin module